MCEYCNRYKTTGAGYCLKCGAPLEADEKKASEEGMFKHASEDLLEEEINKKSENMDLNSNLC